MLNQESVLENYRHKLFWDFEIQTTTRPYSNQQKRENLQDCGLCCPGGPQSEIERMRKEG